MNGSFIAPIIIYPSRKLIQVSPTMRSVSFLLVSPVSFQFSDICLLASIIAGMWAAETPERRLKYKIRADVLKEAHKKAYPSYKYTPRKPSEKKRRASKKTLNKPTTTFCNPQTNNTSGNLGLETFGLNATINHTNMSEQSVEPEESRLSYADETTGMNFTQTESWQMVQQQDLFTFFAARQ